MQNTYVIFGTIGGMWAAGVVILYFMFRPRRAPAPWVLHMGDAEAAFDVVHACANGHDFYADGVAYPACAKCGAENFDYKYRWRQ